MNDKILKLVRENPTLTLLKNDNEQTLSSYMSFLELSVLPEEKIYPIISPSKSMKFPTNFFGKDIWKEYLSEILDQKQCGSCWAFASVSTLADRYNLFFSINKNNKKKLLNLSPVKLLICDVVGTEKILPTASDFPELVLNEISEISTTFGCSGNTLAEAWRYLYVVGTTTLDCLPLSLIEKKELPSCVNTLTPTYDMCKNNYYNYENDNQYGSPAKYYSAFHTYSIDGTDTNNICREIYKWGPVSSAMEIYENFYTFDPKREIYKWDGKGKRISGHAVVIDGWGEENGISFWWIRNSWGKEWGIDGYFKMIKGTNHCKIEENVITGIPNMIGMFWNIDFPRDFSQHNIINSRKYVNSPFAEGGGLSKLGYSRRILSYQKFLDDIQTNNDNTQIDNNNWNDFIAGEINIESKKNNKKGKNNLWLTLRIIFLCIVIPIFIYYVYRFLYR